MARKLHLAGRLSPAILPTLLLLSSTGVLQAAEPAASAQQAGAREILDTSGIKGGLIVHAGCGDGKLTAALWPGKGYIVHGLDRRAANVQSARRNIQTLGLGGKVSVAQWTGGRLPYADKMVNLLLCEAAAGVPAVEVMRVLCPGGVAYVNSAGKRTEVVKPRPAAGYSTLSTRPPRRARKAVCCGRSRPKAARSWPRPHCPAHPSSTAWPPPTNDSTYQQPPARCCA